MTDRAPEKLLGHVRDLAGQGHSRLTDREFLRRFADEHDQAAFRAVVRRHGPLVLGVCQRVLSDLHAAEDALQATFLVLAREAGTRSWQDSVAG